MHVHVFACAHTHHTVVNIKKACNSHYSFTDKCICLRTEFRISEQQEEKNTIFIVNPISPIEINKKLNLIITSDIMWNAKPLNILKDQIYS